MIRLTRADFKVPALLISGPVLGVTRDVLLSAAWLINIVVAEWIIRRRRQVTRVRSTHRSRALAG